MKFAWPAVLPFEIIAEEEVSGPEYERLFGVFGMRARIVRLRLGDEFVSVSGTVIS